MLDIDECSQGLCSGKCVNTVGSYHCSCSVGFFYDAEKRICAGMLFIIEYYHSVPGKHPWVLKRNSQFSLDGACYPEYNFHMFVQEHMSL